jgi:hypothetical protein
MAGIVSGPPVLMRALVLLNQWTLHGSLPQVQPGALFWADVNQVQMLIRANNAVLAAPGSTLRAEPPLTVHGTPGFGAATSNASR